MKSFFQQTSPDDKKSSSSDSKQGTTVQRKLALIIGNSDYQFIPKLQLSTRDADLMSTTLKNLGFGTKILKNLKNDQLKQEIRVFGDSLKPGDIVFFYYSGHAGQKTEDNSVNSFLFGVDAQEIELQDSGSNSNVPNVDSSSSELKIQLNGVSFKKVFGAFVETCIYLVVIDACRLKPSENLTYKAGSGSVPLVDEHPELQLNVACLPEDIKRREFDIVYACQPGEYAIEDITRKHGFLASALAENMQKPQKWSDALVDVINQLWTETNYRQKPQISMNVSKKIYLTQQYEQQAEQQQEDHVTAASTSRVRGYFQLRIQETSQLDAKTKSLFEVWEEEDWRYMVQIGIYEGDESQFQRETKIVSFQNNKLVWNEKFRLPVLKGANELSFMILNKHNFFIAACGLSVDDIILCRHIDDWIPLGQLGKEAGFLKFQIDFSETENFNE